jgi:hypothetical protein
VKDGLPLAAVVMVALLPLITRDYGVRAVSHHYGMLPGDKERYRWIMHEISQGMIV